MDTAFIISVSAASNALVLIVLLLVGFLLSGNLKETIYRYFLAVLLFCLAGACCELALPLLFGTPGRRVAILIRALDFFDYAFGALMIFAFSLYLYEYLSVRGRVSKKLVAAVACLCGADILLLALAAFNQMFARLDASNFYHPQPINWGTMVLPALSMLLCVIATLRNIRNLMPKEWVSLLLYMVIPGLCYVVEILFPGVWVAYLGSAIALFLVYLNIQMELKQKVQRQELELAEKQTAIMLSQIQPHFLYNSLATIDNLFYTDPEGGHEALYLFSGYLRGNMDALSQKEPIPFCQELEHTRQYLRMEKLRFRAKLEVVYEIKTQDFRIPVLTLQPIVENAVRHGVTKREAGGTVRIRTEEVEDCYRVTVKDNGVGFDPEAGAPSRDHMGIANVRGRLAGLCGGRLVVHSVPGQGTRTVIEIPKQRGRAT